MTFCKLPVQEHDCHYIPGLKAATSGFILRDPTDEAIDTLLEKGYRHFGEYFFSPECPGCMQCVPMRVPVDEFSLSRSERRIIRGHADLETEIGTAQPSVESFKLYTAHKNRFDSQFEDTCESYEASFYAAQRQRKTLSVRESGRLISRMHLDVTTTSMSAVYCYYDDSLPKRSLGTYSILRSLLYAQEIGVRYFYLGFYISANKSMRYKLRFYPSEILVPLGRAQDDGQKRFAWIAARDITGRIEAPDRLAPPV